MAMKKVALLLFTAAVVSSCASVAKDQAKKKAKALGLNITSLKEGEACKYVGIIGDDSISKAKSNGGIRMPLFNFSSGNFLKKCTYVYGK